MLKPQDDKSHHSKEDSILEFYTLERTKKTLTLIILAIFLSMAVLYAGSVGSASLTITDVFLSLGNGLIGLINGLLDFISGVATLDVIHGHRVDPSLFLPNSDIAGPIVLSIRLPRILLAILTGISLAVAGAVMQGTLRNPLVSPFTLGLSSAASFGAALAIVTGPGIFGPLFGSIFLSNQNSFIVFFAFFFGFMSMLLIYAITRINDDQSTLVLAGVVIGYLFSAGLMILQYTTNNEKLRDIAVWLMGGMWGANWRSVLILIPVVLIGFSLLALKAWDLNAIYAGDEVAKNLGVDVEGTRLYCLLIATFIASCCLAFTGVIGFIGLMAPHISRMLIGNDYRYVIFCSGLIGALILLLSDTFARTIMSPVDLPVGIVLYVIGGVFFLYLVLNGRKSRLY